MSDIAVSRELVRLMYEAMLTYDGKMTHTDVLSAVGCVAVRAITAFEDNIEEVEKVFHCAVSRGVATELLLSKQEGWGLKRELVTEAE